ncbi:MAG: SH3 domain-containing protein [Chloroflexi bacterium]|nr:SH3 domain-containing protein [Chloroflexota bacterium]
MANPKVRPNDDGIRIRETPGDGRPIGIVGRLHTLDSLESAAETRRKVGIPNEWLLIRKDDGTTGFVAAQFLELVSAPNEPPRLVRCISGGLRIRETPGSGAPVGTMLLNEIAESLESDDETERKLGTLGLWLRVRDREGVVGYVAAWFMGPPGTPAPAPDPAPRPTPVPVEPPAPAEPDKVYVRPIDDGLRIREFPRDGQPIGQANIVTTLESLEPAADSRAKIGVQGQWLNVKTQSGIAGFVAAWMVIETEPPTPIARPGGVNIVGINLDQFHPLGTPDPQRFKGMGWVRFGYNVSMGRGSQDIQAAYNLYRPLAERYARAGMKVMFCFTHQTYGEGRDEFWPWPAMTDDKWRRLTDRFVDMINRIAEEFAGQDLVHCWQVWNEQDAPIGAPASVPMLARNYAHMLGRSIQAIRAADPNTAIITGGHTGGPGPGSNYARAVISALPAGTLPDGIACHPYGRGPRAFTRYANFGDIREELNAYLSVLPDRPVWLSEWGALDKEGDAPGEVANYAVEFVDVVNREYGGRVAALIWYAWAMGMHNGYGVVGRDGQPLQPLFDRFLGLHG